MRDFLVFVRESPFPRSKAQGGDGLAPLALVDAVDAYTEFEAVIRHNDVGSWSITLPAGHPQSKLFIPGRGIVVYQDGQTDEPLLSGPIREIEKEWSAEHSGQGTTTVTGVDDNHLLSERLAWTNPGQDIHLASLFRYWEADPDWPDLGELLRSLLVANTQGSTLRRLDRLFIPDRITGLLPDETARSARLAFSRPDHLVTLLSAVYGFRVRFVWHPDPASVASNGDPEATGPGILLKIEPIEDKTDAVRLGAEFGNLRGSKYKLRAPAATRLVVATQNRTWREKVDEPTYDASGVVTGYTENWVEKSGPERWIGYYTNRVYDPEWWGSETDTPPEYRHTLPWAAAGFSATEVEWGVTAERYKDRRDIPWQWAQDPAKPTGWAQDPPVWSKQHRALQDEVDAFSLDQGPVAAVSVDPLETPTTMFGRDYGLGDRIRIIIDGEVRDEIVREARLSATAEDGARIRPTVGTHGSSDTPYLYASIRELWGSVNRVESREDTRHTLGEVPTSDFAFRKAS